MNEPWIRLVDKNQGHSSGPPNAGGRLKLPEVHFSHRVTQWLAATLLLSFCALGPTRRAFGQDDRVSQLIVTLKDGDFRERANAAAELGYANDPRVVEPLIAALKDPTSEVQYFATVSLGQTKDPRAVEPLIAAMKDADSSLSVRNSAVRALAGIGDPRAVAALIAALQDSDLRIDGGRCVKRLWRTGRPTLDRQPEGCEILDVRGGAAYGLCVYGRARSRTFDRCPE